MINKATFSTEFASKLLSMYAQQDSLVYDSFMGRGTTAKACVEYSCNYIGTEISENQIALYDSN